MRSFNELIFSLKSFLKINKNLVNKSDIIRDKLYTSNMDSDDLFLFEIPTDPIIKINVGNLLCIKSVGNKSKVFHLIDGEVKIQLIRQSLKAYTSDLKEKSQKVIRCHKSFIVNLKKVNEISGNTKGYKIHIDELDFVIPVSRTLGIDDLNQLVLFPG